MRTRARYSIILYLCTIRRCYPDILVYTHVSLSYLQSIHMLIESRTIIVHCFTSFERLLILKYYFWIDSIYVNIYTYTYIYIFIYMCKERMRIRRISIVFMLEDSRFATFFTHFFVFYLILYDRRFDRIPLIIIAATRRTIIWILVYRLRNNNHGTGAACKANYSFRTCFKLFEFYLLILTARR